jgi:hypothetical protein
MSVDPTTQQAARGLDFAPTPARSNSQSSDEAKQEDDVSDKLEQSGAVSLSSDASGSKDEVVFTQAEDKAVRRKLDLIVMPILFLGFYVFQVSPRTFLPIPTVDSLTPGSRLSCNDFVCLPPPRPAPPHSSNEATFPTPSQTTSSPTSV